MIIIFFVLPGIVVNIVICDVVRTIDTAVVYNQQMTDDTLQYMPWPQYNLIKGAKSG